jgi:hypothetical protein
MKSAYFCYLSDTGVRYAATAKTRRIHQVYFHLDILRAAAMKRRLNDLWGGAKISSRQSEPGLILNLFVATTSTYLGFSLILCPYL